MTPEITFEPIAHAYYNNRNERYISVTQLLGLYKQPFDAVKISIAYAKKHGNTPEFWRDKWDNKRDKACEKGTNFHNDKEDEIAGGGVFRTRHGILNVFNPELYPDVTNLPDATYCEVTLHSHLYRVAGKTDVLVVYNGTVDLDDHKTNEKIEEESYSFKDGRRKMMLYPLDDVMDCNYWHYALQLSIYMYLLEMMGYTPGTVQFTHYRPDEISGEMLDIPYPIDYNVTRPLVIKMLNHYLYTQRYQ